MSLKRQVRLCHLSSKLSNNSNNTGKGSLVDMLKGLSPLSRHHPATTFLLLVPRAKVVAWQVCWQSFWVLWACIISISTRPHQG